MCCNLFVDEGVCYTFHSHEVQKNFGYTLNTTSTGSAGGLWLRMDIQQTEEYFFGPENSAGLKVRKYNNLYICKNENYFLVECRHNLLLSLHGWSFERKTLLDDEPKTQELISVKCTHFNLKCMHFT